MTFLVVVQVQYVCVRVRVRACASPGSLDVRLIARGVVGLVSSNEVPSCIGVPHQLHVQQPVIVQVLVFSLSVELALTASAKQAIKHVTSASVPHRHRRLFIEGTCPNGSVYLDQVCTRMRACV